MNWNGSDARLPSKAHQGETGSSRREGHPRGFDSVPERGYGGSARHTRAGWTRP